MASRIGKYYIFILHLEIEVFIIMLRKTQFTLLNTSFPKLFVPESPFPLPFTPPHRKLTPANSQKKCSLA